MEFYISCFLVLKNKMFTIRRIMQSGTIYVAYFMFPQPFKYQPY